MALLIEFREADFLEEPLPDEALAQAPGLDLTQGLAATSLAEN